MHETKKTYREVEDQARETARDADGRDISDDIGNAGDEVRKHLGNAGDNIREGVDDATDEVGRRTDQDRPIV